MRGALAWFGLLALVIVHGQATAAAPRQPGASAQQLLQSDARLGSRGIPFVQPGCTTMFLPGQWCSPRPARSVHGCCTPGHACTRDAGSATGYSCTALPPQQLEYTYEQQAQPGGAACTMLVGVGGQCGGAGGACYRFTTCDQPGPWAGFCCPNGYRCTPEGSSSDSNTNFRTWTCALDVQDQPPVLDRAKELLRYPLRPLPRGACACRLTWNSSRVPMDCPSPWSSPAGTSQVAPALNVAPGGLLVEEGSGRPAVLRGINWFGWATNAANFDGMYAYCDDNMTSSEPPCRQDGDVPPWQYPSQAIGGKAQKRLGLSFWGKRRMTNDFAALVYRIKLLGFNAIRVQFSFTALNEDLPDKKGEPEFYPCLLDTDEYIAAEKTMDPLLIQGLGDKYSLAAVKQFVPKYRGMQHPPPKMGDPQCDKPWSAPFLSNYTGGRGSKLRLTMCNWYLPQGAGVPTVYRFVWQLQYLVSQGLYVLLDFSSSRAHEPNMADGRLLAENWKRLWRMLADVPVYNTRIRGRIWPDLSNEPSRWGCQWTSACVLPNGTTSCAPVLQSYGLAAAAIWEVDPTVPIFVNGLGQDFNVKFEACSHAYPGMHWGDGFITNPAVVSRWNLSSPSDLFTTPLTDWVGPVNQGVRVQRGAAQTPRLVLSPHIYPASVTGTVDEVQAAVATITYRWDLSWGWKMRGVDTTVEGAVIPPMPVVVGETGAKDSGDNAVNNTDTTLYTPGDLAWLDIVAAYLRALADATGRQPSWFFWAWNANSGDTKGIVGPQTTWREVQWTKVRLLIRSYGLRPWYCTHWPDFCDSVEV